MMVSASPVPPYRPMTSEELNRYGGVAAMATRVLDTLPEFENWFWLWHCGTLDEGSLILAFAALKCRNPIGGPILVEAYKNALTRSAEAHKKAMARFSKS